jgi:hypothetical protein
MWPICDVAGVDGRRGVALGAHPVCQAPDARQVLDHQIAANADQGRGNAVTLAGFASNMEVARHHSIVRPWPSIRRASPPAVA